jgi:RHS repeat-associated protein
MISATVNSVTTNFTYRGDGLRNSRTVSGNTTTFTWDIASGLPVVVDDGNQYLYGAGLTKMKQSGSWYYYLADGLGSTMAVVNASGTVQDSYTYDVYGTPTKTGSLANEFDFAGQQTDGTGLQYLRARYMDPATGTFASRDPLMAGSAWLGNGHAYAQANPTRWADPTGLVHCGDAECGGGGGGGAGGKTGPNPVEGKYPKALEPILKGRAGVRSIKGVLESEGYTVGRSGSPNLHGAWDQSCGPNRRIQWKILCHRSEERAVCMAVFSPENQRWVDSNKSP